MKQLRRYTCSWIIDSMYYFEPIQCSRSHHHLNSCAHLSWYFVRKNSFAIRGNRYTSHRMDAFRALKWGCWFMISAQSFSYILHKEALLLEENTQRYSTWLYLLTCLDYSQCTDLTTFLGEEEESSWPRFLKVQVYSFNLFLN